ncbi:Uncharacterized protein ALO43_04442 [Pseudomonas tremae]|uniref:Uncharacterized protein n=5 Tax=Pseudomonas syringae group TaxID=136849 RepID=A0AB37QPD4_9PSED|nr:Uncharacterized protein ALO66_04228 [Pseudomonas coronafaciens pv. atropurpurea]KPX29431.1 Uncharacterized protein ALO77_00997 [Pseudomonas coronafaciens pv. garcae]KPY19028.1 Uncharacterized protein ALO89_01960 [Pseudomonas coronafaciens pv. porri]KPZ05497.1 Uncharacterized protein ALO43_04442 [Pseudomonas tremae]KPZ25867.1 Uncharacterized protein ALO38_02685 [Pseudomonas coronafaciens pv. zizaniae]RMM35491.1 hypothetical protein ALQ80_00847 [Pseudomonas coronafaciens pv. oryzae]RMN99428.
MTVMSFNLANRPLPERTALEDEKSRLFDLWQSNLGKAKGEAARLMGERAKRKGKWSEWVRSELDTMSPPEYANMVRSEVNRLVAAAR